MIDEKYEVVALVGRGGMGAVFEAIHVRINQRVAIKMLHPYVKDLPGSIERFEREARAAGQLRSPNIARVIDVETKNTELPYMVMEFLDGRDLGQELVLEGRLPVTDAVDYLLQACAGMREAHAAGIIHRDLKPANLFLCQTPDGPVIKVVDFGISKITTEIDGSLTAAMTTMGSPVYMSPEQLRAAKDVDLRADIWGLGVILYELIAGRTPHQGPVTVVTASIISEEPPKLSALREDVPPGLASVVARALAKKPCDRYQTAEAFAHALAPFASKAGAKRLRSSLSVPPGPSSSRRSLPAPSKDPDGATQIGPRLAGLETSQSWSSAELGRSLAPKRRSRRLMAAGSLAVVAGLALAAGAMRRPEHLPPPDLAAASPAPIEPAPAVAPIVSSEPIAPAREKTIPRMVAPTTSAVSARAPAKVAAPMPMPTPTPTSNPLHL